MGLDDSRSRVSGNDEGFPAVLDGAELGLTTLQLRHQLLVIFLHLVELHVAALGPIPVDLLVLLLLQPTQLGVSRGDEVVQGVEVRDPLVGQHQELVVGLLQDRHPFAVDLEFLAVEADFGLAAFFHVALELIDDFVLLLVALVFRTNSLDVAAVVRLLDLFL